jgi:hypothetical protein
MLRPHPLAHLRQQLLPQLLFAQTPAAPNRLELLAFLRSTRNHAGRFERASKYAGQHLQAKVCKGASAATSFTRAEFKWT